MLPTPFLFQALKRIDALACLKSSDKETNLIREKNIGGHKLINNLNTQALENIKFIDTP